MSAGTRSAPQPGGSAGTYASGAERPPCSPHCQYLAAGLIDELFLHIVPITLGAGERLLEDVGGLKLDPV